MTIDGLYFPDKIQNLTKAASSAELKVSTGVPRYFVDDKGLWGINLGDCGLTQGEWDDFYNLNNFQINNLKVLHLGGTIESKKPNTFTFIAIGENVLLDFMDVSHNPLPVVCVPTDPF